eukprot:COSAG01_NODE_2060_length_8520_cov_4.178839_4_plen_223_part_00
MPFGSRNIAEACRKQRVIETPWLSRPPKVAAERGPQHLNHTPRSLTPLDGKLRSTSSDWGGPRMITSEGSLPAACAQRARGAPLSVELDFLSVELGGRFAHPLEQEAGFLAAQLRVQLCWWHQARIPHLRQPVDAKALGEPAAAAAAVRGSLSREGDKDTAARVGKTPANTSHTHTHTHTHTHMKRDRETESDRGHTAPSPRAGWAPSTAAPARATCVHNGW